MKVGRLEKLRELALNNPNEEEARSAALAYVRAEAETRGPAPKAQRVSFSSVQSKGKYQTQEQYNEALKARAQEARRSVINNILGKQTDKEVQLQFIIDGLKTEQRGLMDELNHQMHSNSLLMKEKADTQRELWLAREAQHSFAEYRKQQAEKRPPTSWELLVTVTRRILCLSPSSANTRKSSSGTPRPS